MAGLFSTFPKHFKLLDPGAGLGVLSAAVCQRVLRFGSPRSIDLQLFENDPGVVPFLDENMKRCCSALKRAGHDVSYTIHEADFILSNPQGFGQGFLFEVQAGLDGFDGVVMNPPYFKIAADSQYARMMRRIVHGQPNIYALFMALAAEMLRPNGQLVAITPRSFCNGPYFRGFRRWFFERMSLRHIHLFESRADTFRDAAVLQESVITLSQRSAKVPSAIPISTSFGRELGGRLAIQRVASRKVIDDTSGDLVVRIPENPHDTLIMELVESWPKRFTELGLRVSTGPIVMFRAKRFLVRSHNGENVVPLLSVRNVRPFRTVWPIRTGNKPIGFKVCPGSLRLLVPAGNYVLLRRFSAKEEHRRLVASWLLRDSEPWPYIALENHLNYVYHLDRGLADDEVYGLTALFNSALLDRYFRTISGNTQVNAAELRTMKLPNLETIARIGHRIRRLGTIDPDKVDAIVLQELGVDAALTRHLREAVP